MGDRIRDHVAIVTGASRGIGAQVARKLHGAGARVVLAARDQSRLQALARTLGDGCLVVQTDVTQRDQVDALVKETLASFGQVDILINNAGVGLSGIVADVSIKDMERVFAVNVFGALACIQAVVPHMRAQQRGHIVNVSSILGKVAVPQTAGYAASKFALQALSDGLRVEEAPHGIHVTVVCPGSTETDFRANEIHGGSTLLEQRPKINAMTAEKAAELTVRAIQRVKREVILTPFCQALNVLGKFAPGALDLALGRTYHK
jgi:short-subunit dehydrogenase